MNLTDRTIKLKSIFSYTRNGVIEDSKVEIIPFVFNQTVGKSDINTLQSQMPVEDFCPMIDNNITENNTFSYIIFNPLGKIKSSKAILLLHGLNERYWDKYLTWAEDLALNCGAPVILFPIAFHMNRTPSSWYSPRAIMPWSSKRKEDISDLENASFFNLALSSRLSTCPTRFYVSGRESIFNLVQLATDIKSGKNYLFAEDCKINIFAYSIGALLSQTLLIANPDNLFSDSKLFTFCGGSIFERMNGNSKDIMDRFAFDTIRRYYTDIFVNSVGDAIQTAFKSMVKTDCMKEEREQFFDKAKSRIKMITLKKDSVIPTSGAIEAVGVNNSASIIEELDFPFEYSHQIPFPAECKVSNCKPAISSEVVFENFRRIFDLAEAFI